MRARLKYSFLTVGAACLILLGCSSEEQIEDVEYITFPETQTVEANTLPWAAPNSPKGMLNIDSFLIVVNREGSCVFQVYNTNTKKLVVETGTFGRGPNEILNPSLAKQAFKEDGRWVFYVYSYPRKLLYTIDFERLLTGRAYIIEEEQLSKKILTQSHLIKIDSIVIGSSDETEGRIFSYNLHTKDLKLWNYYPAIDNIDDLTDYERYVTYARFWVYNKNKSILAGATGIYFNQLDFYEKNGKLIKSAYMPTMDFELKKNAYQKKYPFYTSNICATGKHIYVLSNPESFQKEKDFELGGVVNVFDWNGVPIKQYFIENKPIAQLIAIDEQKNKIYLYSIDEESGLIKEINL